MKKNKKIMKIRRTSFLNIGTLMFGIVFIYMLICLVLYFTSSHVTPYEVTAGPLSGNYRFSAFALKEEKVITAEQAGNVNYYAREGGKVGKGNNVYSIGGAVQTGTASNTEDSQKVLEGKSLSKLRSSIASYINGFSEISFQNIYNFKSDTESTILELENEEALADIEEGSETAITGNVYTAPQEGIVVYAVDQNESLTVQDIKSDTFDQKNYHKENLRLNKTVSVGAPVYKLITSEDWSLIIPLDKKLVTELADKTTVRFRFLKDGSTFNADFSVIQNGEEAFGKLDISNSLIRYSSDRFVEIELIMNRESGLKIPKSAIAERDFYTIPKEFVTENTANENEVSILKETQDEKGNTITKYITATVYDKTDTEYYIGTSMFQVGDMILKKDSSKKYQISKMDTLQGVYNINKGYAIFREITIIDENEEYCIVKTGSSYGLAQYDRIVLQADTVKDEDIVY